MDNDSPPRHVKEAFETPAFATKSKGATSSNSADTSSFSFQKTEDEYHGRPAREKESIAGLMKDMKLGGYAEERAHEAESSVQPTTYDPGEHDQAEKAEPHAPLKARVSDEEINIATQQSGREDEDVPRAEAINVARHFWSRLDLVCIRSA